MIFPPDYVKMKNENAITLKKKTNNQADPPYDYVLADYSEYDMDTGKKTKTKGRVMDLTALAAHTTDAIEQRDYWTQMVLDSEIERVDIEAELNN